MTEKPLKSLILASTLLMSLAAGQGAVLADEGRGLKPHQLKPDQVLAVMKKVADWQMANPSKHSPSGWEQAPPRFG